MRVGVDARCLSRQLTGIGHYTHNIIKTLDQRGIETVLFSPSPLLVDVSCLNHCQPVVRSYQKLISKQIWFEIYLPFLLGRYDLDVFWGPSHRLPLGLSAKVASVITIHDVVWKFAPETMRKSTRILETLFMQRSIRHADRVIADSQSTQNDIQRFFGTSRQKIATIPLAPRLRQYDIASEKDAPLGKRKQDYILFVGTLEPRKNLAKLIESYLSLSKSLRQSFDLVVVGAQGWGKTPYYKTLKNHSGSETVHFIGYASDSILVDLYRGAVCLVLPSLYEGFGLPIVEAQSFGVPVITSNISSMPEVVGDGGLLVDPNSVESIKNALEHLLIDTGLRDALSQKAKINSQKFSWKKTVNATYDVFSESMNMRDV